MYVSDFYRGIWKHCTLIANSSDFKCQDTVNKEIHGT